MEGNHTPFGLGSRHRLIRHHQHGLKGHQSRISPETKPGYTPSTSRPRVQPMGQRRRSVGPEQNGCERQPCPTRTTNSWTANLVFANSHIILLSIWLVMSAAMSFNSQYNKKKRRRQMTPTSTFEASENSKRTTS